MGLLLRAGQEPRPRRRALLLQVVDTVLEGKTRGEGQGMPNPDLVRPVLGALALRLSSESRDELPLSELRQFLLDLGAEYRGTDLLANPPWNGDADLLARTLRDRTSLLGPYSDSGFWSFWHRSLQEALVAEELTKCESLDEQISIAQGLGEAKLPFWAEPFAMLAEDAPDPDALLVALHQRGFSGLALRALLAVPYAREESLVAVLELDDEQENEQRGEAILRAADLLGRDDDDDAGSRALERLGRLGRRLDRANDAFWSDLFFIDQALAEVGQRAGFERASVDARRELLRDHFPFPTKAQLLQAKLLPSDARPEPFPTIPATDGVWLGSPEGEAERSRDEVRHKVALSEFRLGATPVTRAQFALMVPDHQSWGTDDSPVTNVSWYQATLFSRWLGLSMGGNPGSLPTEAQWEYACRGGRQSVYWSGDEEADLEHVGWYSGNSNGERHPVAGKPANPFGLFDMHGNVWEWCQDWYGEYEPSGSGAPLQDPSGPAQGQNRVRRGGSFTLSARWCRSAYRDWYYPGYRVDYYGFRVAFPPAGRVSILET